jgi:D-amino peptidase
VRVNGELGSEGRLNSCVAAQYGVPVVLVTGDDRTCADAAGYAPQALTVAVKDCVSRYAAVCRPPEVTAAAITAAAARAGKLAGRRSPGRPGAPGEDGTAAPAGFTVEIEVDAAQLAQAAAIVPTVERTGDRRISYQSPTAWDMIRCFKAVTTMIAAATEDSYG